MSSLDVLRNCTVCLHRPGPCKPATHVAKDADGLEWYECDDHGPTDNVARTQRVSRMPIIEWRRINGFED